MKNEANTNSTKTPETKHGDLLNHNGTGTGWCICGERTWKFWMDAGVYHTTCMAGGHWTKKAGA
jgi:uncharacterized protein (DUF2237 family)